MLKILAAVAASAVIALVTIAPTTAPGARHKPHVQKVGIVIRTGDRIRAPNLALAPGVPVRVTVTNYTHQLHTFTVRGLRVSELIFPARRRHPRKTTFRFTAYEWGAFRWHCLICPSGQHGRPHTMGGTLYLVINPSALP